jgi:hypothetical protein
MKGNLKNQNLYLYFYKMDYLIRNVSYYLKGFNRYYIVGYLKLKIDISYLLKIDICIEYVK